MRVSRYGDMDTRGWKGQRGTSIHSESIQGSFYRDVLLGFGRARKAAVTELYFDQRLAASQLAIFNDRMKINLKITYDESLAAYAPGRLLNYLLLKREFDHNRFPVIEYYTNASRELLSGATEQRTINHVSVYRYSWLKPVVSAVSRTRQSLRRASNPLALLGAS